MRGLREFGIQVCIVLPECHSTLTDLGLTTNPSYDLSTKYLKRGYGGVLSFKLKAATELILTKFKLVSLGGR
jgi:O-acetylhomoserine/O-acetylserine sulfhydrylase-like pyridoxal-dependent enzyme